MMDVTLPNGFVVRDVPDDVSSSDLAKISVESGWATAEDFSGLGFFDDPLVEEEEEEEDDTTAIGQIFETGKAIPRGFASSILTAGEGLAELADAATNTIGLEDLIDSGDENELIRLAREGQKNVQSVLGADASYQDKWTTKFGEGLGSFASFLTPGGVAKGLSLLGKPLAAGTKAASVTRGTLFGGYATSLGAGDQAQRIQAARDAGIEISQDQEDKAIFLGGAIGLTELAPIERLLRGLPLSVRDTPFFESLKPRLMNAVRTGTTEAIQEVSAAAMQNAVERGLYNPDRAVFEGSLMDDFTVGGSVGFAADLVFNAFSGRRSNAITKEALAKEQETREKIAEANAQGKSRPIIPEEPAIDPATIALDPADPNADPRDVARGRASQISTTLGASFPAGGQFQSLDADGNPSTTVTNSDGTQFGPSLNTVEEADALANALNEELISSQIINSTQNLIDQSGIEVSEENMPPLRELGATVIDPKPHTFTSSQVNLAGNTTAENGFDHETLSLEDAEQSGIEEKDLTIAQKLNKKRLDKKKAGTPDTNEFTPAEAREVLSSEQYAKLAKTVPSYNEESGSFNYSAQIDGKNVQVSVNNQVEPDIDYGNLTEEDFVSILNRKNIDASITSDEFKTVARAVAGIPANLSFKEYTAADKELLYKRLSSLPKLATKSAIPNFRPKKYNKSQFDRAKNAFDQTGAVPSAKELGFKGRGSKAAHEQLTTDVTGIKKEGRAQSEKAAQEAEKVMKGYGLDKIGLMIADRLRKRYRGETGELQLGEAIDGQVAGAYDEEVKAVFLYSDGLIQQFKNNNKGREPTEEEYVQLALEVLDHEVVHVLRDLDLFTAKEFKFLERKARDTRIPNSEMSYLDVAKRDYSELDQVAQMEEAVAELVRDGLAGRLKIGGKPKSLMRRVAEFFKRLFRITNKFDSILEGIRTGEIGGRERGVIRTLVKKEAEEAKKEGILPERYAGYMAPPLRARGSARPPVQERADFEERTADQAPPADPIAQAQDEEITEFTEDDSGSVAAPQKQKIVVEDIPVKRAADFKTNGNYDVTFPDGSVEQIFRDTYQFSYPVWHWASAPVKTSVGFQDTDLGYTKKEALEYLARLKGYEPVTKEEAASAKEEASKAPKVRTKEQNQEELDASLDRGGAPEDPKFSKITKPMYPAKQTTDDPLVNIPRRILSGEYIPKKTLKAYKLFRTDGNVLMPLYVDSKSIVPLDEWVRAKHLPKNERDKIISEIGDLAYRGGWHAALFPMASHIGGTTEQQKQRANKIRQKRLREFERQGVNPKGAEDKAKREAINKQIPMPKMYIEAQGERKLVNLTDPVFRQPDEVWAEIEVAADYDWQPIANARSSIIKTGVNKGKLNPRYAHIQDQVPYGGFYYYNTSANVDGTWVISGDLKVNRILSDEEVAAIDQSSGEFDLPREQKSELLESLLDKQARRETSKFSKVKSDDNFERTAGERAAYRQTEDDRATRNKLADDLENIGVGGTYGMSLQDITDADLKNVSPETRRLIRAFRKEDYYGYDSSDELFSQVFDYGIESIDPNPPAGLKSALGRYVNVSYGVTETSKFSKVRDEETLKELETKRAVALSRLKDATIEPRPNAAYIRSLEREIAEYDTQIEEIRARQPKEAPKEREERLNEARIQLAKIRAELGETSKFALVKDPSDVSYRYQHQPRRGDPSETVGLVDLTKSLAGTEGGYPDDFYSPEGRRHYAPPPRFYGDEYGEANDQSYRAIKAARGKPEKVVTIYRAVPKDVDDINAGDFVTLSKTYAEIHASGGYGTDSEGNDLQGKVISEQVKVKELIWDQNDVNEFGYFPEIEDQALTQIEKEVKEARKYYEANPNDKQAEQNYFNLRRIRDGREPKAQIETTTRKHDPEGVKKAVEKNLEQATKPKSGFVPKYSVKASPEAQYVAQNPDRNMGETSKFARVKPAPMTPEMENIVNRVSPSSPNRATMYENFRDATGEGRLSYYLTKFRQAAINKYAKLEKLNRQYFNHLADSSSIAAALFSDRSRGILASCIKYGVPIYEGGITRVTEFTHNGRVYRGLLDVMAPLFQNEYGDLSDIAKTYAITRRSKRLNEQGKEVPVTPEEIEAVNREIDAYTDADGNNIIRDWYDAWQSYNDKTIEFLRATGVLNEETARLWSQYSDYYPFYREAEDADVPTSLSQKVFGGDLTSRTAIRELKGGQSAINMDMVEAISLNLTAAIDMGMKNVAQQRIARDMLEIGLAKEITNPKAEKNAISFLVNGNIKHVAIYDPLIYESMLPIGSEASVELTQKLFGPFSSLLRETITRDPGFMVVNLLRDTLSASVTSGSNFVPVLDTVKGLGDGVEMLEKFGVVGGYDYSNDPDDIVKFWNKEFQRRGIQDDRGFTRKTFEGMWNALGGATTMSDAATRNAVYQDVLARTGNEAEAAFQAMEVINFSRRGGNVIARIFTSAIPFLNARFQGLDVFYRAFTGQYTTDRTLARNHIIASALMRGGMLTGLTLAYYLAVSDDEDYKNQNAETRENNWIFPLGDDRPPFKIPTPFEVGFIFKTIPEAFLAQYFGDETGRETRAAISRGIISTLEINPLGMQAIAPLVEASLNHNFFTGRAIVPIYLSQQVMPGMQDSLRTTEFGRLVGENLGISPLKVDHVLRGYFGTLGGYVIDAVDIGLKGQTLGFQDDNRAVMPARNIYEYPMIRRFFASKEGSGLKQDAYELYFEVQKIHNTINDLKRDGRMDELEAFMANHSDKLAYRGQLKTVKKQLDNFREYRRVVLTSDMTADEKRRVIDDLDAAINNILQNIIPQLKQDVDLPVFDIPLIDRAIGE